MVLSSPTSFFTSSDCLAKLVANSDFSLFSSELNSSLVCSLNIFLLSYYSTLSIVIPIENKFDFNISKSLKLKLFI